VRSILSGELKAFFGIDVLRKICNHPDLATALCTPPDYSDPEVPLPFGFQSRKGKKKREKKRESRKERKKERKEDGMREGEKETRREGGRERAWGFFCCTKLTNFGVLETKMSLLSFFFSSAFVHLVHSSLFPFSSFPSFPVDTCGLARWS
jgi:hypothetical protein